MTEKEKHNKNISLNDSKAIMLSVPQTFCFRLYVCMSVHLDQGIKCVSYWSFLTASQKVRKITNPDTPAPRPESFPPTPLAMRPLQIHAHSGKDCCEFSPDHFLFLPGTLLDCISQRPWWLQPRDRPIARRTVTHVFSRPGS